MAKAKQENKPIIISIGYAACHWCHVMEEESFMDTAVANYMNTHFVAIKVDREERPDLDRIYMNAAQLINGNGGWPLNAFALPNGKPFYAGTYFTTKQWLGTLKNIHQAYIGDKARLIDQSEKLTQEIMTLQTAITKPDTITQQQTQRYNTVANQLITQVDPVEGGFKGAPKFPLPGRWEFLLQHAYLTNDQEALNATTHTLDKLARGGIYDHLGGGFYRYATDAQWHVPHFEKMLYDNAQLVSLYAHAYQYTGNPTYRNVLLETLAFVKRELTSPDGGFYSSINADSEGEEGRFYVWRYDELTQVLSKPERDAFANAYAITPAGNWEAGKNIVYQTGSAPNTGPTADLLKSARQKLFASRAKRVRPSLDDKILTAWNALMLKAYVDAYRALGNPDYLNEAIRNARFLEKQMIGKDYQLLRSFRNGGVSIDGFLDDYAYTADALLYLYQSTFDKHWLDLSRALTEAVNQQFYDAASGLYTINSAKKENVLVNSIPLADEVMPSANAVMVLTQYRLGKLLYNEALTDKAEAMLHRVMGTIEETPADHTSWAGLLGLTQYGTYEVAILGSQALTLNRQMQQFYLPNALFAGGETENIPLLTGKLTPGQTRIYVCKNKVCKLPTTGVAEAIKQMSEKRKNESV